MNKFWSFNQPKNKDSKEADLLLYGDISSSSWWGDEVTPKQFADDLAALGDIEKINVRINSGGGDVFAGQAIHSTLKRHKAEKVVYIDGLAASIASVIAMAGDKVVIPKNAMIMVHNPWTRTAGNSDDMREVADLLDKIREPIIFAYEQKTGKTRDELIELMNVETWMTADEAVKLGFADEVESKSIAASANENFLTFNGINFDTSKYNRPPNAKSNNTKPPQHKENIEMNEEILAKQHPDLLNSIKNSAKNEGIKEERARIKDIEDLGIIGQNEVLQKAKFEDPISAEQTAYQVLLADKKFKKNYLNNRQEDSAMLNDVDSADELNNNKAQAKETFINAFSKGFNRE